MRAAWRRPWAVLRRTGTVATLSLGTWLAIAGAEIVEGVVAGAPIESTKGAVMILLLPAVVAVVRRYQRQNAQALAELRRAQNRLCDMAEASSDWLWEMGPDLRFTYFAGNVARVSPGRVQALIGKTRLEVSDRSLAPEAWAKHADDLANCRPFRDFVYPWWDLEGRLCHCRISGRPFFDDAGNFLGYRGTGSDVTAQVEAEAALAAAIAEQRDKDAQFKALASNVPGVVFRSLIDGDWTELFISDGIEQLTGYPAGDFVGSKVRSCASVIHPDDRALCERVTQDAVANRRSYDLEYRVLHKDGSVRWASERTQPVYDDSGRPLYIDGVIFDITERKQAEAALAAALDTVRASERQFRSLTASLPGAVYRYKLDGNWTPVFMSDAMTEISGYTIAELGEGGTTRYADLIDPEDRVGCDPIVLAAAARGDPFVVEYRIRRKDGTVRWMQDRGRGILGDDGRPMFLDGVVFDITDRKAAEAELLRITSHAESANRAKSEFLAMMSHELRTPLNAIIGFSDVVVEEMYGPIGSERYREYLRDIRSSGTHLLDLINDILDLSKAESGQVDLYESVIDIEELIGGSVALVALRARQAGVEIGTDIAPDLPHLRADERKVRQVLLNLATNAIKFTPAGGRIFLRARLAGNGLRLLVEDTGIGMATADIPKALSPFGQIDSTHNRRHTGTGLGLPLTKRLVEAHGATFDLTSEIAVGTIVTIDFPAARLIDRQSPHSAAAR